MPTIYTKDPLGEAIQEQYYGENGVNTGSHANSIGLTNYETRQRAKAGGSSAATPGAPYEPFGFIADIEDRIPRWLEQLLGIIGAIVLVGATRSWPVLPPPAVGGEIFWPGVAALGVAGIVGYCFGRVALRLALRLIDVALKLVIALAIGAALLALGYAAITQLAS